MSSASVEETKAPSHHVLEDKSLLLSGRRLAVVFTAFVIAFSLIALDQTILSTALPTIASYFHAVDDLSWIASAYFLPQAGFMLFFGKILAIAPAKAVFLCSIAIFEIGSLLCAVAFSVNFLIFGRAVAGLGAAGLWVSIMSIIAQITTISQRPLLMGLFGAVFAVSSVVGPLLGGAFSDHVSWRWCFYINLPLGAVAILFVAIVLPNNPAVEQSDKSHFQRWRHLDWIGAFLSFAMVTMLLIAIQWGGNEKPWDDPAVIALLVLFAVLLVAFLAWEYRQGTKAILPFNILFRKTMLGTCTEAFFINLCFILGSYYLPLFFQVRGHSATQSGIDILPFMISGVVAVTAAGAAITFLGYPWPFLFACPLIASVASGLLFTVSSDTDTSRLIGFQILLGIGLGAAIQNTVVVAQAEYVDQESLVPQATSLVTFMQLIGSSVGLAAAGAVFAGQIKTQLHIFAPQLPPEAAQGVLMSVKAIFALPPELRDPVMKAYVAAVDRVFLIGVPGAALASVASLLISRRKVKTQATASM